MQAIQIDDDKALKAPSLLHSFAVIILLLCSISVFNFTVRTLLGSPHTLYDKKSINLIYDLDFDRNWTNVCPSSNTLETTTYSLKEKDTLCFNRTLLYWYIPWVRTAVWKKFNDVTKERRRLKELEKQRSEQELLAEEKEAEAQRGLPQATVEKEEINQTKKVPEAKGEKEPPSSIVYTILTAMTLTLAMIACLELFREKFSKKAVEDPKDPDRRCSLADFTIKRHLRKESQQESLQRQAAFDEPKKVTQLLHQGSLDRAMSILTPAVSSKLPRQSSMPCRSTVSTGATDPRVPSLQAIRKPSLDLSEEDGSPGMRRKSRHFIRRH